MPAQTGYFDTLKSVAGKVFTYLASITLTGTDGKIITCTQDTSLDEAVAMSSKQAKTLTIAGDGTAGRVLRHLLFAIENGTDAATLKCTTTSVWNGDTNAQVNNIAKNATTGIYTLDADGNILVLLNTGISGDCVDVLSVFINNNNSGTAIWARGVKTDTGFSMAVFNLATGAILDLTTLVDTGGMWINVIYLTSA